jgi:outer membrane receptor protein involved in Fe transport
MVNPDLGLYGQTTSGLVGGTAASVLGATNPGYSMLDLSGGYALKMPQGSPIHSLKIKLQVDNALNRKVQDLSSVKASGNAYNVLPTTNYFITFSTEF